MRYLLTILLIMIMLGIGANSANAQTTVAPQSVITLRSNIPDEQWTTGFVIMSINSNGNYFSLIRFPAVGIVSSAVVSLDTTSVNSYGARIFLSRASSAYDSSIVNYNTAPAIFNQIGNQLITEPQIVTFDITAAVNAAFPEPLALHIAAVPYTLGLKSSVQMTYSLASQQPPTPQPTPTAGPTATPSPTATPAAHSEQIDLPSGNVARVQMTATAGELFVAGVLVLVVFILLWPAIGAIAQINSRR
jgi:hypothetical protein